MVRSRNLKCALQLDAARDRLHSAPASLCQLATDERIVARQRAQLRPGRLQKLRLSPATNRSYESIPAAPELIWISTSNQLFLIRHNDRRCSRSAVAQSAPEQPGSVLQNGHVLRD